MTVGASARLLQLLALLQTRPDWSGTDLAKRLGITERTVRRDVERLRRLGYVVDAVPGVGGGYRLGHGTGVPPLLLDPDEAVALAVALRGSASGGLAGLEEAAIGALVKLEQSLPSPLRHRVEAISRTVLSLTGPGPVTDVAVLLAVASATRGFQQLRIDYVGHGGRASSRWVEPHRLVRAEDRWYLLAWDVGRADWRTFRLDRLTPRLPYGRRFTPRPLPDADVAARVGQGITTRPYRYRVRLTAFAPAAVVGEVVGLRRGQVRPLDAERCEVTGGGDDLGQMAAWVAGLGVDVLVHEPPELHDHLTTLAARLERAAAGLRP